MLRIKILLFFNVRVLSSVSLVATSSLEILDTTSRYRYLFMRDHYLHENAIFLTSYLYLK